MNQQTLAPSRLIDRWSILICVGAGAFLFWGAGHYTVFDDEALSCRLYCLPIGEMVRALWDGVDPDPPLYYLAENIWVHLFGVGPLALRTLSIVFFLAGLLAIRAAGEAWFDPRTGRAALLICAVHPAHLFFGFAARWYSLMFLAVAVLLWATARLCDHPNSPVAPSSRRWIHWRIFCWAVAAAAVCYTNYFGPVVVTLIWLAGVWRARTRSTIDRRSWGFAAGGALLLFAAWFPPLWHQTSSWTSNEPTWSAFSSTAARSIIALLAGDLATTTAWWVWGPLVIFVLAFFVTIVWQWKRVRPLALIVGGCLTAGILGRTMIDKYILTFSGPACLLVAALLTHSGQDHRRGPGRGWIVVMIGGLAAGWVGCGVNLVTQSHWSSLRWLDPFETVLQELLDDADAPPPGAWAMTHPAARYYYAHLSIPRHNSSPGGQKQSPLNEWRRYAMPPDVALNNLKIAAGTPGSVLESMEAGPISRLITLETSAFTVSQDWTVLHQVLDRSYVMTTERRYLEDPDADLKDRLDPRYRHPQWRIVLRHWRLRR